MLGVDSPRALGMSTQKCPDTRQSGVGAGRGGKKLSYYLGVEAAAFHSPALSPSDFENPGYNMSYFLVLVGKALSPCPYRGPQDPFGTLQFHQRGFREGYGMILTLIRGGL